MNIEHKSNKEENTGHPGVTRDPQEMSEPVLTFPKEFETSFWERLDRRFTIVLLASLVIVGAIILLLESTPISHMSIEEVKRLQRQFADIALDQMSDDREGNTLIFTEPLDLPATATPGGGSEAVAPASSAGTGSNDLPYEAPGDLPAGEGARGPEVAGSSGGESGPASRSGARTKSSTAGLLGLLASSDQAGTGSASDILGGTGPDLEETLAGASRRRSGGDGKGGTGTGSERRLRGDRDTGGSGINAVVAGLGHSKNIGVARTGKLVINNEVPLIEAAEGKLGGSRDQDEIAAVVAKHNSAIQYCYQRALKNDPELKGKIVVRFVIDSLGLVEAAKVLSSTMNNAAVEGCVLKRIRRWDDFGAIDASKGNTTVRQIYTFGY